MSERFRAHRAINKVHGEILVFDFHNPDAGVKQLNIQPSQLFNVTAFQPHGLGILEDKVKGEHLLYVVNHPQGAADTVEKFRFLPSAQELQHVRSFTGNHFQAVNDVAVVGEDQFYFSNSQYFTSLPLITIELTFRLPLSKILYFNGEMATATVTGQVSPNGVTVSKDGRYLYVASFGSSAIDVFDRSSDQSLSLVQSVPIYTRPDNLQLSPEGDALFVGCHVQLGKLFLQMDDPAGGHKAPSQVLRLPLKDGKIVEEEITELFFDHGDLISGSSVAAVHNNILLIGSVCHKLVTCELAG